VPETYEWDVWFADEDDQLPHSYVYRRDLSLQAGKTYHLQTRTLRPLTWANPDPVMYLVRGNDIVGFNDDYTGLASEIIYTPTVTGVYRLVIRAYSTATRGLCDLYQGVDGAPPSLLEANVTFGGTYVWVRWKLDEWFETGRGVVVDLGGGDVNVGVVSGDPADPYLFLIYPEHAVGSKMYWDDDSAGSLHSKIVPPAGGTGTIILGSYSRYTGGVCRLALVGQSYKAPWMSPAPWAFVTEQAPLTPTVTKYMEELKRRKPKLERLSPDERDRHVLELQRTILSEEELRGQLPPPARGLDRALVRRQEIFAQRYSEMERDLAQISYDERAARLAHVKREAMGREYSEPARPAVSY
jgi:hypothetical protein